MASDGALLSVLTIPTFQRLNSNAHILSDLTMYRYI